MSSLAGLSIELWVEARAGRAAVNPIIGQLLTDLAAARASARVRVLEHEIVDPVRLTAEARPDLVLLKSATTMALSIAVADEACGVKFLNSARATLRAHDKAAAAARLAAAGMPIPTTYLIDPSGLARLGAVPAPHIDGHWVVKPTRGVHGRGVSFHPDIEDALRAIRHSGTVSDHVIDDGTRLLQRRVGADGPDLKVYVADGRCFAGSKRFSAESYASDETVPCELDRHTMDIVHAAGEALDLSCYGVDLRSDGGRVYIVDLNPFPGYRGFPDAVAALRAEVERALEEIG